MRNSFPSPVSIDCHYTSQYIQNVLILIDKNVYFSTEDDKEVFLVPR